MQSRKLFILAIMIMNPACSQLKSSYSDIQTTKANNVPSSPWNIQSIPGHSQSPSECESEFPEEKGQVEKLLKQIYAGSPDIFNPAAFDSSKICVRVVEGDGVAVATGDSRTLTIEVSRQSAIADVTEASFQDLLSHELGHILLNHSWMGNLVYGDGPREILPWLEQERKLSNSIAPELDLALAALAKDPQLAPSVESFLASPYLLSVVALGVQGTPKFIELKEELNRIRDRKNSQQNTLFDIFESTLQAYEKSFDRYMGKMTEIYGSVEKAQLMYQAYREIRADELGLYLYKRAGFKPTLFFYADIRTAPEFENTSCQTELNERHARGEFEKLPVSCASIKVDPFNKENYYDSSTFGTLYVSYYPKPMLRWNLLKSFQDFDEQSAMNK